MYAKIMSTVVVDVKDEPLEGYIPCGINVIVGWEFDGNAFYPSLVVADTTPSTVDIWYVENSKVLNQIYIIEEKQTTRLYREALMGSVNALDTLKSIEDRVTSLRLQLTTKPNGN